MTDHAPTELLRCPFCSTASIGMEYDRSIFARQHYPGQSSDEGWKLRCDGCGNQTAWWHSQELAKSAWNTRQAASVERAEPEEHGSDGKFRPATQRAIIARAVLRTLQNPIRIETIDWEIADAVLALGERAEVAGEAVASSWPQIDTELSAYVAHIRAELIEQCAKEAERCNTHALFCIADPRAIRSDVADRIRALTSPPRSEGVRSCEVQSGGDLVTRLRTSRPWTGKLVLEAADEIERLRGAAQASGVQNESERIAALQYEAGMYKSLYENAIEQCAKFVEQHQESTRETSDGSTRYLSPRKVGNQMGLAYVDGIRSLALSSAEQSPDDRMMDDMELADNSRKIAFEECCEIIQAIDSGRGNEKEILKAIQRLRDTGDATPPISSTHRESGL